MYRKMNRKVKNMMFDIVLIIAAIGVFGGLLFLAFLFTGRFVEVPG